MRLFWLILVSLVPGLLWVYYFYKKDRYEPEPLNLVLKSFFYGALAVIPVGIIEAPFSKLISNPPNLMSLMLVTVGVVGFFEELAKFSVIRYTVFKSEEFNEVVDGIIYSVSAGLGFAALENLLYAYVFGFKVGIVRAIITSLVHASFSGIMGYYLGKAKIDHNSYAIIIGLAQTIILHGVYDFLIISGWLSNYAIYGMVVLLYLYLIHLINKTVRNSPFKKI